jgi:carboxylate-amine ligase
MSPGPAARELLDPDAVRHRFDATDAGTVGLEEEVLILDPETLLPVARATEVVEVAADPLVKEEMPACQVELVSPPRPSAREAVADLIRARRRVAEACSVLDVVPAAATVHPIAVAMGSSGSARHRAIEDEFGEVARRQLVGSLQVHVALGDSACALAVYNALRGHLPELAALASSAPFSEGRDTGFASVRPLICGQLPRQGVPPAFSTWEEFTAALSWGRTSGSVPEPRRWWWELRPHIHFGTLEVRVSDVQATSAASAAVAEVVAALVRSLAARHQDGEILAVAPTWRIEENRWSALRDGVHGELADLVTGDRRSTARRLLGLLDEIEPFAPDGLDGSRALVQYNGADDLRKVGLRDATAYLSEAFLPL